MDLVDDVLRAVEAYSESESESRNNEDLLEFKLEDLASSLDELIEIDVG